MESAKFKKLPTKLNIYLIFFTKILFNFAYFTMNVEYVKSLLFVQIFLSHYLGKLRKKIEKKNIFVVFSKILVGTLFAICIETDYPYFICFGSLLIYFRMHHS